LRYNVIKSVTSEKVKTVYVMRCKWHGRNDRSRWWKL